MQSGRPSDPRAVLEEQRDDREARAGKLERLLEQVEAPDAPETSAGPTEGRVRTQTPTSAAVARGSLRVARVVSVSKGSATIAWRGSPSPVAASLAPEVEPELIADAAASRGAVLVEDGSPPLIVGLVQTSRPRELKLRAGSVVLEGEEEVLIRAGRAAVRLRADGDIEIVGSRISAASRGLFRLVGRILRLN
jgi:hypothetical protein